MQSLMIPKSVLWKLTDQILFSNLIRCSKSYLNAIPLKHIQRRYVEEGQYDLCIDEGTQVTPLTSHEWSSMPADTKIVMRIIIQQETTSFSDVDYQCHFCGAVNPLGVGSVMYSLQRQAGCSIDCRICKRRFQISRERASSKQNTQPSNIDSNNTTDAEMRLIRNFHATPKSPQDAIRDALSGLPADRRCPGGYDWVRDQNGYRCSGGGHYITWKELGVA
ncbi:hypothetical protein EV702DRAFT_1066958 [Suillus placidus]|uniref:Uncharacterized protein n=1 Tax=Suillus placidus TaxID=48579 RepID=A0A9P7A497_9AGAM|nr:hypothetical protein EV702DRAFT_1066958 [Suillus placidus]